MRRRRYCAKVTRQPYIKAEPPVRQAAMRKLENALLRKRKARAGKQPCAIFGYFFVYRFRVSNDGKHWKRHKRWGNLG